MSNKTPVVVFDLGGVVIRICHTWQEALSAAGVNSPILDLPPLGLLELPGFNEYQANDISFKDYIKGLSVYASITLEEAERSHRSILKEPYPGIESLIGELQLSGIGTGCLSNTNAPHWEVFMTDPMYSIIAGLKFPAGSHELGSAKPELAAFQAYSTRFGIGDLPVVFFDDSKPNVVAARSLGWDAHVVDPLGDPPAQMRTVLAELLAVHK